MQTQFCFRKILVQCLKMGPTSPRLEKALHLSIAVSEILSHGHTSKKSVTPIDRIEVDSIPSEVERLNRFQDFFMRLPIEERLLLVLKDKHQVNEDELSLIFRQPLASLHTRRSQTLDLLRKWIFEDLP